MNTYQFIPFGGPSAHAPGRGEAATTVFITKRLVDGPGLIPANGGLFLLQAAATVLITNRLVDGPGLIPANGGLSLLQAAAAKGGDIGIGGIILAVFPLL